MAATPTPTTPPPAVEIGVTVWKLYHDTPHGQLHCHISHPAREQPNHDRLPVLLLHMSASSGKSCLPLMRHLSSLGFHCLAPDMPGFGNSFDPDYDPPAIEWYSDLYHTLLSHLPDFERGCHVIGHHSGAVIGVDLAKRFPGFVQTLTMVGPAVMSAAERQQMAQSTMLPFNRPAEDGSHLQRTWDYLLEMGIPSGNTALLHREALDHLRAWRGRLQIYACVWAYDCGAAMGEIGEDCRILALCAQDDVLWPFFHNVAQIKRRVEHREIGGANFGPDLAKVEMLRNFLAHIE